MSDTHESDPIPFNRPQIVGDELMYVDSAVAAGRLAGSAPFGGAAQRWLEDRFESDALIEALAAEQIQATFHYIPLHSSPAGRRFGRCPGTCP